MNDAKPGGEVRPISDRKPPNAAETPGARPKSAVLRNHEARSGPRSLAFRAATTQGRPSAAGIWEMSVKIGAKVVTHGRYVAFQLAEVAVPRMLFAEILRLIAELRPPDPAPA